MNNVNDIIASDWFNYMNYLSGGDKIINYSWKKTGISKAERKEIKSIFQEIDDVTGLSFVKTKKKDSDLHFVYVNEILDDTRFELLDDDLKINQCKLNDFFEDAVVGRASARKNRIKIFIKDNDNIVNYLEKYVLRHEIGHSLGLSHPGGVGDNPDYTSKDTIMSYNVYSDNLWNGNRIFRYFGFTDLDIQALQCNWGLNEV